MTLVRTSCPPIIVCLFCLYIRSLLTPVRTSGMPRFTITRLQISSIPPLLLPLEEEEEACRSGSNDRNSSPRRIRGFIASFPFQERSERTREGTQNVLCVDVKKDRDYIYMYIHINSFVLTCIYTGMCAVLCWCGCFPVSVCVMFPCLCLCSTLGTHSGHVTIFLTKKKGKETSTISWLKKGGGRTRHYLF